MRQRANLIINEIVQLFLEAYPDLRYVQALFALGILDQTLDMERGVAVTVDRFYEEPIDTLKRCEKRILEFFTECPEQAKCVNLLQRMQEVCNS